MVAELLLLFQVEMVYDEMKGRLRPGSSWLFVHNDVDNPCVSSLSFTYTENDKNRVRFIQNAGLTALFCLLVSHYVSKGFSSACFMM